MTSKLTREERIQSLYDLKIGQVLNQSDIESIKMLARIALAAMDSSESVELPLDYLQGHKDGLEWAAQLAEANHPETGDWLYDDPIELAKAIRKGPDMPPAQPVAGSEPDRNPVLAYADSYRDMAKQGVESVPIWSVIIDLERNISPLYRHAQPAPESDQVRREHAEWSQATFGNVGPVGPLKHLSKEALEAAAEPGDLSEWADMQFLLWDAQRRAGITDEQITQAMIEKLAVNKQREWPEPKDGEPRLHIKAQPAPVVPDESYQQLSDLYHAQEKRLFKIAQRIKGSAFDKYSHSPSQAIDVLEAAIFGDNDACRAAMLQELQKSAGVSNNCRSNEKLQAQHVESLTTIKATPALDSLPKNAESRSGNSLANDTNVVKRLTITLPDTSSKAFWSGTGKTETFHPVTYRRWVKEAIERYCAIARIDVEVK